MRWSVESAHNGPRGKCKPCAVSSSIFNRKASLSTYLVSSGLKNSATPAVIAITKKSQSQRQGSAVSFGTAPAYVVATVTRSLVTLVTAVTNHPACPTSRVAQRETRKCRPTVLCARSMQCRCRGPHWSWFAKESGSRICSRQAGAWSSCGSDTAPHVHHLRRSSLERQDISFRPLRDDRASKRKA